MTRAPHRAANDAGKRLRLTLYGRRDCHLCDIAKETIARLRERLDFEVDERDVDDDPAWAAAFGEQVPVGFVGERKVFKYRVDEPRLERALRREP